MENSILNESIYDLSFMVKAKKRPHKKYNKKLYILLTNTKTVIGRTILKITGSNYNHASLSLTKNCTHVYGFGRNTDRNESGFIKEDLLSGIYKNNEVDYKLLEFGVTEEEHRKIIDILKQFELNKDFFKFDNLGLALAGLNIPHNKQGEFFCSGFIQYVLTGAGVKLFDKNYALVKPNDFNLHPDLKEVGSGKIKDLVKKYRKELIRTNDDLVHENINTMDLIITENDEGVILTEAGGISPTKRKKIEQTIYDVMNIMDKTGSNAKKYKERFSKMNNQQFDTWIKKFLKDEQANFYLEVVPFENEPSLKDIEKAAKYLNIPLDEYVYLPFQNPGGEPIRTAEKVPVGYLHIKRMQQLLSKKNTFSTETNQRNSKTGQISGADKNAVISDAENFAMNVIGANAAMKEFMSARADDMVAKAELEKQINNNGYATLKDLPNDIQNKQSLNTLDVFFLGAGIVTDLVTPGLALKNTLDGRSVKTTPNAKYK